MTQKPLQSLYVLVGLALLLSTCGPGPGLNSPTGLAPTPHPTFTPLVIKTSAPSVTPLSGGQATPIRLSATPAPPPGVGTRSAPVAASAAAVPFSGPDPSQKPLHFILVQHARCSWDAFWCPVEQGIQDAARDLSVTVSILGPESLDLKETASQIDEAVAAKPDGIALTVSDPVALREPILRAIASGIPIIAYNAGGGPIRDQLPYLTYLGMDDYQGGYQGALRLIDAGARAGVCVNEAPALADMQTRCQGFRAAFTEKGLKANVLNTTRDMAQVQQDIQAYALAHPEVNAYLTDGSASASAFYAYLQAVGRKPGAPGVLHGTFDLNPEISANIENGTTLFGIDQQPYLQGYEAVVWLTLISRYGLTPALPVTATGPRLVDKSALASPVNPARPLRLYLVHHGLCSWDPYWCVIDQGAQDAARNMNVQLTILGPESFDLNKTAELVGEADAAQPDGLIVAIPDAQILRAPILRAIQAGEAVVAIDSGFGPVKDKLPYLTYVGQDEYQAGYLAALRLIAAGANAGVCVIQQKGQAALEARCQGLLDAFRHKGLNADELDCGGDPATALRIVQAYAQAHPEVNAYLTLSAQNPGAITIYDYLKDAGRKPGEVLHGTFDLSPAVAAAIRDGTTLFTVDAQPYLQGYSTVMALTLLLRRNIWPVSPITPSGPAFVDQSNIDLVTRLTGKYR